MSELPSQSLDIGASPASVERPRSKRWQVSLRTLALLLAMIAVWMTVVVNRRHNTRLETRIRAMLPLAHDLKIDDTSQFAVVKLDELWMDDNRWDVYLPPGEYRIGVATREVDKKGLAAPKKTTTLKGGKHRLGLEFGRDGQGWRFRVSSDDSELFTFDETKDWGSSGSSTGAGVYSQSTQLPADQPLVLYRRRCRIKVSPRQSAEAKGPTDGLLMWIEPVAGSRSSP